jgi:ABC-type lipoprotein export system ATPase subunit
VEISGRRVDHLNERELARVRATQLGFVFQFHHLLPEFNAEENVMMPLLIAGADSTSARRRAREALQAVGLEERWLHRPAELSGGEAQRVAIARALAVDAPVLLMDEPTASLDPERRTELAALVRSLVDRDRALIVATHDEEFARAVGTRVLRVREGRLAGG